MTAPLHAVDDALVRLRRLWSSRARQVLEDGDRPVEMSSVLVVEACARGAAAGEEVTVGGVAHFTDVEHSTASRLVDRAVRAGLIVRAPSASDARRIALVLSPQGRDLRERSVVFRTSWLAGVLDGWSENDVADLARLLARFAGTVVAVGGPGSPPSAQRPAE